MSYFIKMFTFEEFDSNGDCAVQPVHTLEEAMASIERMIPAVNKSDA